MLYYHLAAHVGIEPTSHDSESHILPLDEQAIVFGGPGRNRTYVICFKGKITPSVRSNCSLLLKMCLGVTYGGRTRDTRFTVLDVTSTLTPPRNTLCRSQHSIHTGMCLLLVPSSGVEPLSESS